MHFRKQQLTKVLYNFFIMNEYDEYNECNRKFIWKQKWPNKTQ